MVSPRSPPGVGSHSYFNGIGVVSRSGPGAPLATSAPGLCARSGGIDMVFQPAPVITPETGTRSHTSGIGIVCLPASGRSVKMPALGTRSQSGGIDVVSQPASASAVTYATSLLPCSETTVSWKLVWLWAYSNYVATRSEKPGLHRPPNCRNKSTTTYSP